MKNCMRGALVLVACGGTDTVTSQPAAGELERPSAISPSCTPAADCLPVTTKFFEVDVCCSETLRCGLNLTGADDVLSALPAEEGRVYDPSKPCWPRSYMFLDIPRYPESRVAGAAGDILVTPDCLARELVKTPLPGCCLPDNSCGLSTHIAGHTFALFLDNVATEPFTGAECVSTGELNKQLASSKLAYFAFAPASSGTCNYAALNAALPRLAPRGDE